MAEDEKYYRIKVGFIGGVWHNKLYMTLYLRKGNEIILDKKPVVLGNNPLGYWQIEKDELEITVEKLTKKQYEKNIQGSQLEDLTKEELIDLLIVKTK